GESLSTSRARSSFALLFKENTLRLLLAIGLVIVGTTFFYVNLIFMPTYASKYLNLTTNDAFIAIAIGALCCMLLIPCLGWLSDFVNRKVILVVSLFAYLLCIFPCFIWLVNAPSSFRLIVMEIIFCISLSGYFAVFTTISAELFSQ